MIDYEEYAATYLNTRELCKYCSTGAEEPCEACLEEIHEQYLQEGNDTHES